MPNIFVYVSENKDAVLLAPLLDKGGSLALALREATARALPPGGGEIEVRLIIPLASNNTTRVQIFCVASKTPGFGDKAGRICFKWASELARAWATSIPGLTEKFPLSEINIWTTMSEGQSHLADEWGL